MSEQEQGGQTFHRRSMISPEGVGMADLKDFRIFSDLKDKELDKLRENLRTINYGRGEIIFQEGAPAFG